MVLDRVSKKEFTTKKKFGKRAEEKMRNKSWLYEGKSIPGEEKRNVETPREQGMRNIKKKKNQCEWSD